MVLMKLHCILTDPTVGSPWGEASFIMGSVRAYHEVRYHLITPDSVA